MRRHVKTSSLTYDSVIDFDITRTSRTVSVFCMKNNSPLKGQLTRSKNKHKVGQKMAVWNINNSQAKNLSKRLEKILANQAFPIDFNFTMHRCTNINPPGNKIKMQLNENKLKT
jgi:hypothetical protein